MFEVLARDEQDTVRLVTIGTGVAVAQLLQGDSSKLEGIKTAVKELFADPSWRVRYIAADKMVEVQTTCGLTVEEQISIYTNLLRDVEAEVRVAALSKLHPFCDELPDEGRQRCIVFDILPVAKDLTHDSNQHVRCALAQEVMGIAHFLENGSVGEHILPIFLILLRDISSEVRLNIISSSKKANCMFGQSEVQKAIVNEIVNLARDGKWRVRLGIIGHVPTLADQLGREFFDARLFSLCMGWLVDAVYEIREAAALNLKRLATKFGAEWALNEVIPRVMTLAASRNYLHRLTCLSCINELYGTLDQERIIDELFPTIRKLSWDSVPNVRFNVAKTLAKVGTALGSSNLFSEVKPIVMKLCSDPDSDVRFFADKTKVALGLDGEEERKGTEDVHMTDA